MGARHLGRDGVLGVQLHGRRRVAGPDTVGAGKAPPRERRPAGTRRFSSVDRHPSERPGRRARGRGADPRRRALTTSPPPTRSRSSTPPTRLACRCCSRARPAAARRASSSTWRGTCSTAASARRAAALDRAAAGHRRLPRGPRPPATSSAATCSRATRRSGSTARSRAPCAPARSATSTRSSRRARTPPSSSTRSPTTAACCRSRSAASSLEAHADFLLVISYNPGYQSVLKDLKPSTRQRFVCARVRLPAARRSRRGSSRTRAASTRDRPRDLAKLGEKVRNLREHGLEEGVSTRLLVYAAQLIAQGIAPRRACQVAISRASPTTRGAARGRRAGDHHLSVSARGRHGGQRPGAPPRRSARAAASSSSTPKRSPAGTSSCGPPTICPTSRRTCAATSPPRARAASSCRRRSRTSRRSRENFAMFKIAILHQLGFWECGTYSFTSRPQRCRRSDLRSRGVLRLLRAARAGAPTVHDPRGHPDRRASAAALPRHAARVLDAAHRIARAAASARAPRRRSRSTRGAGPAQPDGHRDALGADRGAGARRQHALAAALPVLRRAIDAVRDPEATVYTTAAQVESCVSLFGPPTRDDVRGAAMQPSRRPAPPGAKPEPISMRRGSKSGAPAGGDDASAAASVEPVPFRGAPRPELVQKELRLAELESRLGEVPADGAPLPPEVLRQLLERGEIEIGASERRVLDESSGLSTVDLPGLADRVRDSVRQRLAGAIRSLAGELEDELGDLAPRHGVHYYDEWDHEHARYRRAWCRLTETRLEEEATAELDAARARAGRALLRGEAPVRAAAARRSTRAQASRRRRGHRPRRRDRGARRSPRRHHALRAGLHAPRPPRARGRRRVPARHERLDRLRGAGHERATEAADWPMGVRGGGAARDYDYVGIYDDDPLWGPSRSGKPPRRRRVIDVEKEALLLMAEALDALGDAYGIYGFSGYGREQVEFYVVKDFDESCDQQRARAHRRPSGPSARRAWVRRSVTPRASCARRRRGCASCSSSPTASRRTTATAATAPAGPTASRTP